ncbi:MAG: potassium/proton antiporter [Bacteroides sp.]|nr:potassium/proton antiporter [Bacteroides sp.]
MVITIHNILLILSLLLFFAILAGKTSSKIGVPALILFMGIGMLAGSEGIGKIEFGYEQAGTAQFIGITALCFILFSGGLDTKWSSIKPILGKGMTLSTLGVVLTAAFVGVFVKCVTDFSWTESFLLGSIVSSTDAAAVFNILNAKNLSLKNDLKPLLEFESGSNDPVAFLLTTFFVGMVGLEDFSLPMAMLRFLLQLSLGAFMGFVMGRLSTVIINHIRISYTGLYPVLAIALMLFTYSFTDFIGGNGFLAVYISAIVLGNRKLTHRNAIVGSFDGYAWLMQLILFLTLGLLVFPGDVWAIKWTGLVVSGFIILVGRPLAVFLCLLFFKRTPFKDQVFISWVGLRGAAPIVFATYPLIAGLEKSNMIFSIVFFISFLSMALQGTSIPWLARRLHLAIILPFGLMARHNLDTKTEMFEIEVEKGSPLDGKTLLEADLPEKTRITMIMRHGDYIVPMGETRLQQKDYLYILCKNPDEIKRLLSAEDSD